MVVDTTKIYIIVRETREKCDRERRRVSGKGEECEGGRERARGGAGRSARI